MVINFNPKYIPGDIVYNHKKEIIRITSSYLKGTKLFYYRDGNYGWIREDAIKPIPLTPEILEKNGWKKEVMSRGVKNSHCVYTKPDIKEYGYFPIYIEKGIEKIHKSIDILKWFRVSKNEKNKAICFLREALKELEE